jgi:uncharacterized protein (DUF58 family)
VRANRLSTRRQYLKSGGQRLKSGGKLPAPDQRLDSLHQAEALGAMLPPLLMRIESVAASMSHGLHGRRRVGPGETFWQFRGYQPGDSTRRIDWRRSARSQRLFIRQTEWEAAQSVWLWRDGSASMRYRSSERWPTKIARAELLLLAIASLLVRGGERLALLDDDCAPAPGRAALRRLAMTIGLVGSVSESLPRPKALPRYGNLVMTGDFLAPLDHIKETVAAFAGYGVVGHLVQIMDPAEETLPFSGRVRFEGAEEEGSVLIGRVEDIRADYQAALALHRQELKNLTRSLGWTFTLHHTDRPPQPALLALYLALSSGGR